MSRVYHAGKEQLFHTREEIEQHLLEKVKGNTSGLIGTELELFVTTADGLPPGFDRIEQLFGHIAEAFEGTQKITEKGRIVGLHIPQLGDICLEPGGQVELSSKPCRDLQELETVNRSMRAALDAAAESLGLKVLGQGHLPSFMTGEDMPRSRFAAYYCYCRHEIGQRADALIQTMKSVCSLQVNIDPMGEGFHEIYRSLLLVDVAMAFNQASCRHERLDRTYARLFPEQLTPVFEALAANSNEQLISLIVDRLLTLKVPFVPDSSPEGFASTIDVFGAPPTVGVLLGKGLLTGEILDNALSLQLTLPNLRRHGVLETRAHDSVNTVEELISVAGIYRKAAYDPAERKRLLSLFKAVDADLLRVAFNERASLPPEKLMGSSIGKGLTVRTLVEETGAGSRKEFALKKRGSSPRPKPST